MVEPLGNGRFRVGDGERNRVAYAVADRSGTWVFLNGRSYVVNRPDRNSRKRPAPRDDDVALSAPMPATVVAVKTAPGQDVREGDLLVMLEAMKMELPIKAPRAGRVKSIACREGELVAAGVPLLELE